MTACVTACQRRIARVLRELTDEAGYPPSIREIAEAVALSASTVAYHLQALERHDIVTHDPHRSRSYQVSPRASPAEALGAGRVRYRLGPAMAYTTVPLANRAHAVPVDAVVAGE
ncbi:LexA family protein [Streptomyces caniferus]|uniref:LexA family protein n=1 Tax=Streptomyces caniferus TaxID=285557 RepID=UPI00380B2435